MSASMQKRLSLGLIAAVMLLPSLAFGSLSYPGEQPHPYDLADLVARRNWPLVGMAVVWAIVRLLKSDSRLPDALDVHEDLRPLVPIVLGAISGCLEHLLTGVPWKDALTGAAVTAFGAILAQDVIARALLRGLFKIQIPLPPPLAKPSVAASSSSDRSERTTVPTSPTHNDVSAVTLDKPENVPAEPEKQGDQK